MFNTKPITLFISKMLYIKINAVKTQLQIIPNTKLLKKLSLNSFIKSLHIKQLPSLKRFIIILFIAQYAAGIVIIGIEKTKNRKFKYIILKKLVLKINIILFIPETGTLYLQSLFCFI